MPIFKQKELSKLFRQFDNNNISPIYLLFGEGYLVNDAAATLIKRLLPDQQQRINNLKIIDGEQEEPEHTLSLLRTYNLFGSRLVIRVNNSKLLYSKKTAKILWGKAKKSVTANNVGQAYRYLTQMLALANLTSADWITENIAVISAQRWQSLFAFNKPSDLAWVAVLINTHDLPSGTTKHENRTKATDIAGDFHINKEKNKGEESCAKSRQNDDPSELFVKAFEATIPPGNILILIAEAVDKRKRFYKYINQHGTIIDLSVDTAPTFAAQKNQQALLAELVKKTLAGFNKKLEPRGLPLLFERVGFHPAAIVMETEKLALYAADSPLLTVADINKVVGRTRQEALYEFTEAFGTRQPKVALSLLCRLLENNVHPLVIISGLRNHLEKLLLARAFEQLSQPDYVQGLVFTVFQKKYFPQLQKKHVKWPSQLSGHPYTIYKIFKQAEKFSLTALKNGLLTLLEAEYSLKNSIVPDYIILDNLIFNILLIKK